MINSTQHLISSSKYTHMFVFIVAINHFYGHYLICIKFAQFAKLSPNLCHLSGSADEEPVIGAHPAVHHPNVARDL